MTKPTPEQRAEIIRWAEALESGEYRQADGALRAASADDGESFYCHCCLGVYADKCGAVWRRVIDDNVPFVDGKQVGGQDGNEYLHHTWFEARTGIDRAGQVRLADMNDAGISFADIASALRYYAENGEWPTTDTEES